MTQHRVGGRLFCQWSNGDALMGKYTALSPEKKVAFTLRSDEPGDYSEVSITIAEKAGVSAVTLSDSRDSKALAGQAEQIEQGWNEALDNLQSVLETGIDQRLAKRPVMGIEFDAPKPGDEGIRIAGTVEDSGAREAGIQKGDLIVSIGKFPTPDIASVTAALSAGKAGDKVKVTVLRDGKKVPLTVTLGARTLEPVPATAEALAEIVARKYTDVNRDLTQAFKGVSEEKAARAPAPGEWSARHILAHLIAGERHINDWITNVIAGQEPWQDEWEGNLRIRLDAVINGFPTIQALLTELKRNEAETVAMLNALPDSFVARKGSYDRVARTMLSWPDHTREHLEQIRSAVR
jgi:membrane-associated protease RseP (regulator of RpoE activity)